jgi:hypothetical protein
MGREPTVIGVSDHNGWAVFVCVAARAGEPVVTGRRRVDLIEPGLPNQPYEHDTRELDTARAEALVREVRESAVHCAERALVRVRSSLGGARELAAIALRKAPLPGLPASVAEAHASYPVMVRADAMLYHDALCMAAAALGIRLELIARGQERQRAAEALRTGVEQLDQWLAELRASLGPPWQKDHQAAAARAIATLGKRGGLTLPGRRPDARRTPSRR